MVLATDSERTAPRKLCRRSGAFRSFVIGAEMDVEMSGSDVRMRFDCRTDKGSLNGESVCIEALAASEPRLRLD